MAATALLVSTVKLVLFGLVQSRSLTAASSVDNGGQWTAVSRVGGEWKPLGVPLRGGWEPLGVSRVPSGVSVETWTGLTGRVPPEEASGAREGLQSGVPASAPSPVSTGALVGILGRMFHRQSRGASPGALPEGAATSAGVLESPVDGRSASSSRLIPWALRSLQETVESPHRQTPNHPNSPGPQGLAVSSETSGRVSAELAQKTSTTWVSTLK